MLSGRRKTRWRKTRMERKSAARQADLLSQKVMCEGVRVVLHLEEI